MCIGLLNGNRASNISQHSAALCIRKQAKTNRQMFYLFHVFIIVIVFFLPQNLLELSYLQVKFQEMVGPIFLANLGNTM